MSTIFQRSQRFFSQKTPTKFRKYVEKPLFPTISAHRNRRPPFCKPVFYGSTNHPGPGPIPNQISIGPTLRLSSGRRKPSCLHRTPYGGSVLWTLPKGTPYGAYGETRHTIEQLLTADKAGYRRRTSCRNRRRQSYCPWFQVRLQFCRHWSNLYPDRQTPVME